MDTAATQFEYHEVLSVQASPQTVFDALVHRFSAGNTGGDNQPMPMKLELWPGGRWYRDLGGDNGHIWAHVQSIKKPNLIEFYGQLFMSFPVNNHIIIRIQEAEGGSTLDFRHTAFGIIDPAYLEGMEEGWSDYLNLIKSDCE